MKTMKKPILSYAAVLGVIFTSFLYMACDDDSNAVVENVDGGGQTSGDAGPINFDAGVDEAGNQKDCFDPPYKSHFEIINGCTNADKITRTPTSTKLLADGGVPQP